MSNTQKYISIFFLLVSFISLGKGTEAFAKLSEAESTRVSAVAGVNIYNPVIVSEKNGEVRVGFDIANNSDTAQGDIKYGIDIIQTTEAGQTVVDSFVADEALSLIAQGSAHKELTYTVPPQLNGAFDIWVMARTSGGKVLGLGRAGYLTFTSSFPHITIIPESCTLAVGGDTATYTLYQGVDVASTESLSFSCMVENHFQNDVTVTPTFTTHFRTMYGESVDTVPQNPEPITLKAGEKKQVLLTIPKASAPQAYDVSVALVNTKMNVVSNEIVAHYVLRGESATIQNATLDKTAYAKGETVTAQVSWSPSADGFPGSRGGVGTPLQSPVITLELIDTAGVSCIEPITYRPKSTEQTVTLTAPTIADCTDPKMRVSLRNDEGISFDTRTYASPVISQTQQDEATQTKGRYDHMSTLVMIILVITTVSSLMILYVLLSMRAIMRGEVILKSLILTLIIAGSCVGGAGMAKAATFELNAPYNEFAGGEDINEDGVIEENVVFTVATFSANTDKTTYAPNETISLSAMAHAFLCENNNPYISIYSAWKGEIDTNYQTLIDNAQIGYQQGRLTGYGTFTAPATVGTYDIDVMACYKVDWMPEVCSVGTLTITVSNTATPDVVADGSPKGVFGDASCAESPYYWTTDMDRATFSGWACDPDNYGEKIMVEFYEGATLVGSTIADIDTGSLVISNQCGGTTAHGFSYVIPESLLTGTDRVISAKAKNSGASGSDRVLPSDKTVRCTIPPLPDISAVNESPADNQVFSYGQTITFSGRAVNSGTVDMGQGGRVVLEIDVPEGTYTFPSYDDEPLDFVGKGQSKQLSNTLTSADIHGGVPGTYRYRFIVDVTDFVHESNEDNNASEWRTFTILPEVSYSGTLSAPASVDSGTSAQLTWTLDGITASDSCEVSGGGETWTTTGNGSATTKNLTDPTTYVLSCNGNPLDSENVGINGISGGGTTGGGSTGNPDLSTNTYVVNDGDDAILSWDTKGEPEAGCSLNGGTVNLDTLAGYGGSEFTGELKVENIVAKTTYTLECLSGTDRVTIEISPAGWES